MIAYILQAVALVGLVLVLFALTAHMRIVLDSSPGIFHMGAFYESVDPGAAFNALNAVADPSVFTSGVDMRVPKDLPQLLGATWACNDASLAQGRITSPSLRAVHDLYVEPGVQALVWGSPPEFSLWNHAPVPLVPDEAINFEINSDPAAAVVHYGLVLFGDGPTQEVSGPIYTMRATTAIALAAGTWVNGEITFSQTLPRGQYAIVGMRARGTNLVAARLVFRGAAWRPGVPALNAIGDRDYTPFRFGRIGVFGVFDTNTPPSVDALGVTDTSQVLLLDLQKVG